MKNRNVCRLIWARRAKLTAAFGLVLGVAFADRVAFADQAPNALTNAVIVPVYWNGVSGNVTPEVVSVLPSFYADFSGQLSPATVCGLSQSPSYSAHDSPQDATPLVREYGVQSISMTIPYTAHVSPPAPSQSQKFLSDSDIGNMLTAEIRSGGLQAPACNRPTSGSIAYSQSLYVVHLPPGSNATDPIGGKPNTSCGSFAGYHVQFPYVVSVPGGKYTCQSAMAVILDESPGNGNGCDVRFDQSSITANGLNFGMINAYTYALSHELLEALVDPFLTQSNGEIGDQCQKLTTDGAPVNIFPGNSGTPWVIASTYSAANKTCWVGEQSWYVGSNGYATLANSTMPSWGWDSEAYKSAGFALARGATHMDIFSVKNFEGATNAETTPWDTAYSQQKLTPGAWDLVGSGWRSPALPSPAIGQSPEPLDTGNVAPLAAPMTAVSPSPTSIYAFVAGNDQQVDMATCTSGDGCRTQGSWTQLSRIQAYNGTYQVAPSTPIAAVSLPGWPLTLFFAGSNGELFELQRSNLWTLTQVAPPGTVPTKAFVSAIGRWEVLFGNYMYDVFFADAAGTIHFYDTLAAAGGGGWIASIVSGSAPVSPGTQIAALTRVPGQIDIFAVDANGAVQSFWSNEYFNGGAWNQVIPPIMPAGTALPGAGVAAAGWATHMDVFTTGTSTNAQSAHLYRQTFDECTGWLASPSANAAGWPRGIQLQAVTRYRDSVDVFGLESTGGVLWQGFSTQFQGLPQGTYGGACTAPADCSSGSL